MKKILGFVGVFGILVMMSFWSLEAYGSVPPDTWSVTQNENTLEISYGSGSNLPQYAVLHLDSSYFRMNYGTGSAWGTSIVLLPAFWTGNTYYQGASITASWKTEVTNDLVISFAGTISTLYVQGEISILTPYQNSISALVEIKNVDGDIVLDNRPGEAFKPVMLSSMHISSGTWDTQLAYVDGQSFQIPQTGWIVSPPATGTIFKLIGGTSNWKTNAPTISIGLDQDRQVTGYVTDSILKIN